MQFYPNFALFSTLGGMNLDHVFVQVWKFSEDQKKMQMEHFFPQTQVKTKNFFLHQKVFIKSRTLFSPIFAQMYTHSNYWGDSAKLLGGYIPHPLLVSTPLIVNPCSISLRKTRSCIATMLPACCGSLASNGINLKVGAFL